MGFPGQAVVNAGDTEMQVRSLGQEDPLEKKRATHSHILAWEIPWTEEPGGLQVVANRHDRAHRHATLYMNLEIMGIYMIFILPV